MARKQDPWRTPKNYWEAAMRVSDAVIALENARPALLDVLRRGRNHPAYHNLVIELGNLDYELRALDPERDAETGEVLHPNFCKRGGAA